MASYTVQKGETLSGIASKYGLDWRTVFQANPSIKDPNKIYAGQSITIPEKTVTAPAAPTPAGSLQNTLPPENPGPATTAPTSLSLPNTAMSGDQLSSLRLALRATADAAKKRAVGQTTQDTLDNLSQMGIKPSGISGSTFAQTVNFIADQQGSPVERQFNDVVTAINEAEQRKQQEAAAARDNLSKLQQMIKDSGKAWSQIPPELQSQIADLEQKAGIPLGSTQAFTRAVPQAKLLTTTTGYNSKGQQVVTFVYADENGNPKTTQTIVTGAIKQTTPKTGPTALSISQKDYAAAQLAANQNPTNRAAAEAQLRNLIGADKAAQFSNYFDDQYKPKFTNPFK